MNVGTVLKHYVEAALWSSWDGDDEPLDKNYSITDIHHEALARMWTDVKKFVKENENDLLTWREVDAEAQSGHDFWLTRNRHGSGFWESEWGDVGEKLTEAAVAFGECDLYVGDDDLIHLG